MQPKVSIIVPVYKVEKYLKRCVDSILSQTYRNLDVILVNDGSPDNCGRIAEEYTTIDKRVRAFHKENGGLSDARNFGMKYVAGVYTMFVDSDDWLEPEMVEQMVITIEKYAADIVQSAFYYAYEDYLLLEKSSATDKPQVQVIGKEALVKELVNNQKVKNFAWGKLYKTALIEDIPFKKGVLFEDVFWAHQVMHRADKYVLLNKPFYNYFQREDSIVADYNPRNLDIIKGLKERHNFIQQHYPDLSLKSSKLLLKTSLEHYNLLFLNRKKDPGGKNRKELQAYIKTNIEQFKQATKNDRQLYRQLVFFHVHPWVNIAYLGGRKLLRRLKLVPVPVTMQRINYTEEARRNEKAYS